MFTLTWGDKLLGKSIFSCVTRGTGAVSCLFCFSNFGVVVRSLFDIGTKENEQVQALDDDTYVDTLQRRRTM